MRAVHTFVDGDKPVTLEQRADASFRVTYGQQIHDRMSYAEAATTYGFCVFHSLLCARKLYNGNIHRAH